MSSGWSTAVHHAVVSDEQALRVEQAVLDVSMALLRAVDLKPEMHAPFRKLVRDTLVNVGFLYCEPKLLDALYHHKSGTCYVSPTAQDQSATKPDKPMFSICVHEDLRLDGKPL